MKYVLEMKKGYPVIIIDGRKFMVDTGGPTITYKDEEEVIQINGEDVLLEVMKDRKKQDAEDIMHSYDEMIDGVIGRFTLYHFGIIEFDLINKVVIIGETTKPKDNVLKFHGERQIFKCKVNGIETEGMLDTGTHVPMMFDHKYVENTEYVQDDWEPSYFGKIPVKEYKAVFEINGKEKEVNIYDVQGFDFMRNHEPKVYFGMSAFVDEYLVYDFNKEEIYYK